jgi:hypothetical protein
MRTRLAVLVLALVTLAGCGEDDTPVARDPAPTTTETTGNPTGPPAWPACESHSQSAIDYVAGAKGAETVEEALAQYVDEGTTVVRVHAGKHRPRMLFDVVDEDNRIVREVSLVDGGNGWLVDGVETCSD